LLSGEAGGEEEDGEEKARCGAAAPFLPVVGYGCLPFLPAAAGSCCSTPRSCFQTKRTGHVAAHPYLGKNQKRRGVESVGSAPAGSYPPLPCLPPQQDTSAATWTTLAGERCAACPSSTTRR